MLISAIAKRAAVCPTLSLKYGVAGEASFLEMVSQYFDKAGDATDIPKDRLNFLKSPDYSLKFNIPYKTGKPHLKQTPGSSKSSRPSEFSTKPITSPQRAAPDMLATSISKK